jgi:hypothetical protein
MTRLIVEEMKRLMENKKCEINFYVHTSPISSPPSHSIFSSPLHLISPFPSQSGIIRGFGRMKRRR